MPNRAFGWLLRCYPAPFRRERRDELLELFDAALARERPRIGTVRAWIRLGADAAAAGLLMRRDERRRRRAGASRQFHSADRVRSGDSLMRSLM